jgi:transcriptional regulator with XRE-family HTH domain
MSSSSRSDQVALLLAGHVGITIAEARESRTWTLRELAGRSGVSTSMIHAVEHGKPASLETYAAIAGAIRPRYRGYADAVEALRRQGSM